MSLTPAMIDAMLASGCTAEQMAAVIKAALSDRDAKAAEKRAKDAERQRKSRINRGLSRDVTVTGCDERDTPPLPPPLSPQTPQTPPPPPPVNTPRARKGTETTIAPGWRPAQFGKGSKSREIVDGWPPGELQTQVEHFTALHRSKGSKFKDWQDAWSTWVLNSRRFGGPNHGNHRQSSSQRDRGRVDGFTAALRKVANSETDYPFAGNG